MKNLYSVYAKGFSKGKTSVMPPSIEIDLTNMCNQNCIYCCSAKFRKKSCDVADISDYISLLHRIKWDWFFVKNTSLPTITFVGGGEPTASPYFTRVVKEALTLGFLVGIVTNGTKANKLLSIPDELRANIAWVGVDIDAGTQQLYDKIRRPLKADHFSVVCENISKLVAEGFPIDLKILLFDKNCDTASLEDIFVLAKRLGVRQLHMRAAVFPNRSNDLPVGTSSLIENLSKKYAVPYWLGLSRTASEFGVRSYAKCFALFLLPVFSADGKVYLCCEYRGKENLCLGSWIDTPINLLWLSKRHFEIYDNLDPKLCMNCRMHVHNNNLQNCLAKSDSLDQLFF